MTTPARPGRITEITHLFALSVWFGCLLTTAAAAAVLFPTIKEMAPTAPAYAAYPFDHWTIIAGRVGLKLFTISDSVQLVCGSLAFLTFGMTLIRAKASKGRPWGLAARGLLMTAAMTLVCYQLFMLAPRMHTSATKFWRLAEVGKVEEANAARALFDEDHPMASSVLGATSLVVLGLWFAGAFAMAGPGQSEGSSESAGAKA